MDLYKKDIIEMHMALEPCPFCKSEGMIIENSYPIEDNWYRPACNRCPCVWEESYGTIQEALDAWNKRA